MTYIKTTNAEIDARVSKLEELLTRGMSSAAAVRYAVQTWSVGRTTGNRYVRWAKKRIALAIDKEDIRDRWAMTLARYDDLYFSCIKEGNHAIALHTLNAQAKFARLTE